MIKRHRLYRVMEEASIQFAGGQRRDMRQGNRVACRPETANAWSEGYGRLLSRAAAEELESYMVSSRSYCACSLQVCSVAMCMMMVSILLQRLGLVPALAEPGAYPCARRASGRGARRLRAGYFLGRAWAIATDAE